MNDKEINEMIRVHVTSPALRKELESLVMCFIHQQITFAISRTSNRAKFCVWRQILPGDKLRVKNGKKGMIPGGVIEQDQKDLNTRNFIHIFAKENGIQRNTEIANSFFNVNASKRKNK